MLFQPDIVVVERGELSDYLLVVEVETAIPVDHGDGPLAPLGRYMSGMGCPMGLLVTPERVWVLRDTLRVGGVDGVVVLGEYTAPTEFLSEAGTRDGADFKARVQRWLERMAEDGHSTSEDEALRRVLDDEVIPVLLGAEIRSGNPREIMLEAVG